MRRDKLISVRVNSLQYEKFLSIVESYTKVYDNGFGARKFYEYDDGKIFQYSQFTVGDLLEKAMDDYINNHTKKLP